MNNLDQANKTRKEEQSPRGANLCDAILASVQLLGSVREGVSLTESLAQISVDQRPVAQSLSYTTLRNVPVLQWAMSHFIHKKLDTSVEDILLVAASTLLPKSANKYATHTLVNEAVKAAASSTKTKAAKGLVNAVLRRLIEHPEYLNVEAKQAIEFYPSWWIRRLKKNYPRDWQQILEVNRTPAGLFLRINPNQYTKDEYLKELQEQGISTIDIPNVIQQQVPFAIALAGSTPVTKLPGFDVGAVSIQDLGAQRVGHLAQPQNGQRVLDACAAPGGKSTHLLELAKIDLTALEIDPKRIERVKENLLRSGEIATLIIGDASNLQTWWKGEPYDLILADVPCSATGIIRRHPDILYLRREEDFVNLRRLQRKIISELWKTLKPGGRFIYVTCSILPEEGEDQCQWFVDHHTDALRLECIGQAPPTSWGDGFFYGAFTKIK